MSRQEVPAMRSLSFEKLLIPVLVVLFIVSILACAYNVVHWYSARATINNATSSLESHGFTDIRLDAPEYGVPLTGTIHVGVCDFPITFLNYTDQYLLKAPEGFSEPLFALQSPRIDDLYGDAVPSDIVQRCLATS